MNHPFEKLYNFETVQDMFKFWGNICKVSSMACGILKLVPSHLSSKRVITRAGRVGPHRTSSTRLSTIVNNKTFFHIQSLKSHELSKCRAVGSPIFLQRRKSLIYRNFAPFCLQQRVYFHYFFFLFPTVVVATLCFGWFLVDTG